MKTHQMFSLHTTPVILDLSLRKTRSGKSHDYRDAKGVFEKLSFHNVFRPAGIFRFLRFEDCLDSKISFGISADGLKNRRKISPAYSMDATSGSLLSIIMRDILSLALYFTPLTTWNTKHAFVSTDK